MWSCFKRVEYQQNSSISGNIVLNINDENYFENKTIAVHLKFFFTTIAGKLVEKLSSPKCL